MEPSSQTISGVKHYPKNGVLIFPFKPEHIVRIGTHITCTCGKDWDCTFLKKTVQRIWDTNNSYTTYSLKYTDRMPSISCPICLQDYKWLDRGSELSICDSCSRVYCLSCVKQLSSSLCGYCRTGNLEKFEEKTNNNTTQTEHPMSKAKFDNIKDDAWIPTNLEDTKTLTNKLISEMLQRDEELWSLAKDYDLENSRKVMEHNKQYDLDHGTVPYNSKWDHSSQDSSSDSDMNV